MKCAFSRFYLKTCPHGGQFSSLYLKLKDVSAIAAPGRFRLIIQMVQLNERLFIVGGRGGVVVSELDFRSEGRWFDA